MRFPYTWAAIFDLCKRVYRYTLLVRTLTTLLDGGNADVQRALMRLMPSRGEAFLGGIAARIERAQGLAAVLPSTAVTSLRVRRRQRRRRRRRVTGTGGGEGGSRGPGSGGVSERGKDVEAALSEEHDAQMENAAAVFKLLQRMTEGHFAPMQARRACVRAPCGISLQMHSLRVAFCVFNSVHSCID